MNRDARFHIHDPAMRRESRAAAETNEDAVDGEVDGHADQRIANAITVCRMLSLVAAILLWTAWSESSFYLILAVAFGAGVVSAVLSRLFPNSAATAVCRCAAHGAAHESHISRI